MGGVGFKMMLRHSIVMIVCCFFITGGTIIEVVGSQDPEIESDVTIWENNKTIEKDHIVGYGETLIMKAGIVVQFNQSVTLFVNGTLIIEGKDNDKVLLTLSKKPLDPNIFHEYWIGICYNKGSKGMIMNSIIEYAFRSIDIYSSGVLIFGNTIRGSPESDGINIRRDSDPIICNNSITDNHYGISCNKESNAIISNNIISNNRIGIVTFSSIAITNNKLISNQLYAISCSSNASPILVNCYFDNNYFDLFLGYDCHVMIYNSVFDINKVESLDDPNSFITIDGEVINNKEENDNFSSSVLRYSTLCITFIIIAIFIFLII